MIHGGLAERSGERRLLLSSARFAAFNQEARLSQVCSTQGTGSWR